MSWALSESLRRFAFRTTFLAYVEQLTVLFTTGMYKRRISDDEDPHQQTSNPLHKLKHDRNYHNHDRDGYHKHTGEVLLCLCRQEPLSGLLSMVRGRWWWPFGEL